MAALNLILMVRPKRTRNGLEGPEVVVLVPARNEEKNLKELLPRLFQAEPHLKVYVFDDESSDKTAQVARDEGAIVLQPSKPLPQGWTGKNRACDTLAKAAMEDSDANWIIFLDADTRPGPLFIPICRALADECPSNIGVISGFPKLSPGAAFEPLFLAWVPWVLLTTNPFGIASRTGIGHNQFTNGQFTLWRKKIYEDLMPNEALKGVVLEDVHIGRLLKKRKIGLRVLNMSEHFTTHMYDTWRQAYDGLSKNAFDITGNAWGTYGLALLMLALGFGWVFVGPFWYLPYGLLCLSGIFVFWVGGMGIIMGFAMPIVLLIAACTLIRSASWRMHGKVTWKGRIISSSPDEKKS